MNLTSQSQHPRRKIPMTMLQTERLDAARNHRRRPSRRRLDLRLSCVNQAALAPQLPSRHCWSQEWMAQTRMPRLK
jgi:hypothetical protein